MAEIADSPPATVEASTTGRHIPALDGIRGLAILLVFCVHFLWSSTYTGHNPILWTSEVLRNVGWTGVSLFFVLSGFLITGILYDTRHSERYFRNFYARRALRIFPLYYGAIALGVVLALAGGGHVNGIGLVELLTYTRNLVLGPVPAVVTGSVIQFNHFWTLAVEEQFYLVWPPLVYVLKTRRRIAIAALAGIMISIVVRVLLDKSSYPLQNPYVTLSWTPASLDGLCFGALLALGMRSSWRDRILAWSPTTLLLSLGSLLLLCFKAPYLELLEPQHWTAAHFIHPAIYLLFVSLLATCLRPDSWSQRFFALPPMRFFGRYSYGLYVFHYSIVEITYRARPYLAEHLHSRLLAFLIPLVLGVLASVLLALASFRYFEAPILSLKRYFADRTVTPKLASFV